MNLLDMRTIILTNVVTNIVYALVITLLWYQSRKRFAGTAYWVFDFFFQAAALMLIVLRGGIPDWMSVVLSNTLVIVGALLGYMGLERFVGKTTSQNHNYIFLAIFVFVQGYFTFVQPDLAVRNLNVSVGLLIICSQCAWLMLYRVPPGLSRLTLGVGIVFSLYCLVSIVRIAEFFTGPPPTTDFFRIGTFEVIIIASYQVLFIFLTFGLTLMVNWRLHMEIRTQEKKFSTAFRSSPYAIILTRISDGSILEVNDGFVKMSGFRYDEVVGKTTLGLNLWVHEEDRVTTLNELSRTGKVQGVELPFRKKTGEEIAGIFSAEIISINDEDCILASISDITERKRVEEEIRFLAITDQLTGLYNRRGFFALAEQQLKVAERAKRGVFLLYADLDNMKWINDHLGHNKGDEALVGAASVLRMVFRESDILARLGGDEYAVLALDASPESSHVFEERLQQQMAIYNRSGTRDYKLSMSVGFVYFDPERPSSLDDLISRADALMYEQKSKKKP